MQDSRPERAMQSPVQLACPICQEASRFGYVACTLSIANDEHHQASICLTPKRWHQDQIKPSSMSRARCPESLECCKRCGCLIADALSAFAAICYLTFIQTLPRAPQARSLCPSMVSPQAFGELVDFELPSPKPRGLASSLNPDTLERLRILFTCKE